MFFMGVAMLFRGHVSALSMCLAFMVLPMVGFHADMIVLFSFLMALGIVVDRCHRRHREHTPDFRERKDPYCTGG
jgi:multidrug efflux pump subunit AcrB